MAKDNKKKSKKLAAQQNDMLCDGLSFILHEEYRLLRTNIMFSISDEKPYRCIGITSSIKGEAKSTTAINLAYTFAENGEKVCLVEADMRMPTIKKRLGLKLTKGLSETLTGQASDVLEKVTFKETSFYCIQAGTIPPNPSELLSSSRMEKLLEALGRNFTYVIVDLPPVTLVSDPLVMGRKLDGVVVVVAQPFCTKRILKDVMRQLFQAKIRVLGFVRTFTTDKGFGYYKYGKKKYKYNNYYYYRSSEKDKQESK